MATCRELSDEKWGDIMNLRRGFAFLFLAMGLAISYATVSAHSTGDDVAGAVDFPVGCNSAASAHIEQGVYQLHHMMYANTRELFRLAEDADPGCAIALWGVAMTYIHPLWPDRPS